MMKDTGFLKLAAIAVLAASVAGAYAGMGKSLSYELEYAVVDAGSESTASADYAMVSTITADGVAAESTSSTLYSMSPVVGGTSGTIPVTLSAFTAE